MCEKKMVLSINGEKVEVHWEENATVSELKSRLADRPLIVDTLRYGDFEQVGALPQSFTRNDVQMTAKAGDVVLYSGDQLVVFFGSNSWSYTKLGHIDGRSENELTDLLDTDKATIVLFLE